MTAVLASGRACDVEGCGRRHHAQGYCDGHYGRLRRHGDPLGGGAHGGPRVIPTRPAIERFNDLVARDECWAWLGHKTRAGYGLFRHDGRTVLAHRWAWAHFMGPIQEGMQIDHLCRNTSCVNPQHLEPVTASENVRRERAARAAERASVV